MFNQKLNSQKRIQAQANATGASPNVRTGAGAGLPSSLKQKLGGGREKSVPLGGGSQ